MYIYDHRRIWIICKITCTHTHTPIYRIIYIHPPIHPSVCAYTRASVHKCSTVSSFVFEGRRLQRQSGSQTGEAKGRAGTSGSPIEVSIDVVGIPGSSTIPRRCSPHIRRWDGSPRPLLNAFETLRETWQEFRYTLELVEKTAWRSWFDLSCSCPFNRARCSLYPPASQDTLMETPGFPFQNHLEIVVFPCW